MTMDDITLPESARLIELEKVVVAGLQSWIEVGEALIEIRDSRLYRIEAGTFEEYCQSKFKIQKSYVYQLMTGSKVARDLSATADVSQKAIREIAKVAPEKRQEVFEKATATASGHVPTAREIKQVVEIVEAEESPKQVKPKLHNKGLSLWNQAKALLDQIHPHDLSREDAMKEAISYATKRLEKNK